MTNARRPPMSRAEAAALLGVPVDADRATARHAYLRLARQVHPDASPSAPDAAGRFDALSRARAVFEMPPPPTPTAPPAPVSRQPSASIGNALLVLVLLVFLLVALVTLDAAIRTHGFEQDTTVAAATTPA